MKKYIISIENEIKEYFEQTISNLHEGIKKYPQNKDIINNSIVKEVSELSDNIAALIDYYVDGIYDSGKNSSRKKLKLNKQFKENERYAFNENDVSFIKEYKENKIVSIKNRMQDAVCSFIEYILENDMDFKSNCLNCLEELVEYIVVEIISLYKRSQLEEYKNLGINKVIYQSEESDCLHCSTSQGKIILLSDCISDFGITNGTKHTFCKYSFNPIINDASVIISEKVEKTINVEYEGIKFNSLPIEMDERLNRLFSKIRIPFSKILKTKSFDFVDDITSLDIWEEELLKYLNNKGIEENLISEEMQKAKKELKDNIVIFSRVNQTNISNNLEHLKSFEYLVTKELIINNDNIFVDSIIQQRFNEKQNTKTIGLGVAFYRDGFVNYLAEESAESYLKESIVSYMLDPIKLETIDKFIFNYIKEQLLNKSWESDNID